MEENKTFLGQGWSFPPTFNKTLEEVELVANEKDIEQSLQIILSTRISERIMRPEFGCDLQELLFSSINLQLKTYIKDLIDTAILYFEPRIDINRINLNNSNELEGVVLIEIDYTIRSTNSRGNIVYPFYRGEGTDVQN